eukprot:2427834-Amphidinium_carterae.2
MNPVREHNMHRRLEKQCWKKSGKAISVAFELVLNHVLSLLLTSIVALGISGRGHVITTIHCKAHALYTLFRAVGVVAIRTPSGIIPHALGFWALDWMFFVRVPWTLDGCGRDSFVFGTSGTFELEGDGPSRGTGSLR